MAALYFLRSGETINLNPIDLFLSHINPELIDKYMKVAGWIVLPLFILDATFDLKSIDIVFVIGALLFLYAGITPFFNDKVARYIIKEGTTIDEAKYSLYFLIYTGIGCLLVMALSLIKIEI